MRHPLPSPHSPLFPADYVIGELLSSSHMLSKERPIDASSSQSLDQQQHRHQRTNDWEPPDEQPRNVNMLFSGAGITLLGEDVLIRDSFPGRISAQAVRIRTISESEVSLSVKSHFFTPADESRFTFESVNETSPLIAVGDNVIGNVYFGEHAFHYPLIALLSLSLTLLLLSIFQTQLRASPTYTATL